MKSFLSVMVFAVALMGSPNFIGADSGTPVKVVAVARQVVADDVPEPAPVEFKVEGPTKIKVGELAVMSIEKTGIEKVKWVALATSNNFLVVEQGKRAVFCSPNSGEFIFIVAGAINGEPVLTVHKITVTGGEPKPADTLADKITSWCEQVQSPNKKQSTLMLAQSFSSVAAIMEGGSLTTPEEIVSATAKANRDALGADLEAWMPLRDGLAKELKKLSEDGKLATPADHLEVWKLIASSLREYAATLP